MLLFEALSLPFMWRALEAGVLVALFASYYGVFVVQRGLSFLGDGLAHAAFGGVALGILLGVEQPLWVAVPFTILVAAAIVWIQERTSLKWDTAIGILFPVSFALGIVFLSLRQEYARDAFAILFGSILAVSHSDLWIARAVAAASLLTLPLWGRWAYATVDRELARSDKLSTLRDDYILAIAIAVAVVVASKVVGVLLVGAFLVIPSATARLFAKRFSTMTLLSVALGVVSVVLGLLLSYQFDLPSGPTVILTQALFFTVGLFTRR